MFRRQLTQPGVPARAVPKRARQFYDGERDRLVARYQAGALVSELTVELELNRTTIAKQLKAAGVTLRGGPMIPGMAGSDPGAGAARKRTSGSLSS